MISTRSQKGKQKVIHISSSSDSESEEADEVTEESDAESTDDQESDSDSDDGELSSDDGGGSESDYADGDGDDDDDEEEEEDEEGPREGKRSDEEIYNKIIDLIQRRRSLNALRLEECKVYLRKHHLRLSGAKEICIERILEHRRVKDGNAQKLYPWESFSINCTGDVCTGDVVRFKQRVYEKFDKATRGGGGKILGKRTVAGRVVKESYGAAKQQHTFTVEVLWSKGVKPLAPLVPLLVKGRNLYRLKTFRQSWSNETERSKILAEKHKRGAAARHTRAIAKSRSSIIGQSKRNRSSSTRAPPEKRRKKDPRPATTKKKKNTPRAKSSSTAAKAKPVTLSRHTESSTIAGHTQALLPNLIRPRNLLPQRSETFVSASHPKDNGYHGHVDRPQMPQRSETSVSASHPKDNGYRGYNDRPQMLTVSASHPKDNGYRGQDDRPQMLTPYNYHYAHADFQQRREAFTSHHSYNNNASFSSFATGAYNHIQNTGPYVNHHPNPNPWFDDPRYPRHAGPGHFSSGPYFR